MISTIFLGIVVGYAEMLPMDADKSSSIRPSLVNIMSGGTESCRYCAGSADPGQKGSLRQKRS
jgi:hypothetical protein